MTPHLNNGRCIQKPSSINGTGTFSTKGHQANEHLGVGLVKLHDSGDAYKDFYQTRLGDYLNHSPEPNAGLRQKDNQLHVHTLKNISPGEEVVVDYREPLSPVKNDVTPEWDRQAMGAMSKKAALSMKKSTLKLAFRSHLKSVT